jgi:phosphoribosylpyrophosphate synthetase
MEASFNARLLAIPAKNILEKLSEDKIKIPKIKFYSIDIHNLEEPFETFKDEGFEFVSIDSSNELAKGTLKIIKSKRYLKVPIKLIVCDKGAIPRTEKLAESLLKLDGIERLEIVYIEKKRATAGIVKTAEIVKVAEWKTVNQELSKRNLKIPSKPNFKTTCLIFSDDMIDTGGTAEKDIKFISSYYPNALIKVFVATHPVFSKGFGALKKIGADYYCVGNTLDWDGIKDIPNVEIIDMSETIYQTI